MQGSITRNPNRIRIEFHSVDKAFTRIYSRAASGLVRVTSEILCGSKGVLEVNILDKKQMYSMTGRCFGVEYDTDVIALTYASPWPGRSKLIPEIFGEVILSVFEIKRQSREYEEDLETTFFYLLLHGILHVKGYSDETKKERRVMEKLQIKYLNDIRT